MILCVCRAVREREVDAAIAGGARTVREVGRSCGAGVDCGACVADVKARLHARRQVAHPLAAYTPVETPLAAK